MKLTIIILLVSTMAFGMLDRSTGDWGSGGGNAIVCFGTGTDSNGEWIDYVSEIKKNKNIIPDKFINAITSIEMYDLYEAKKRRGIGSKPSEILEINKDEKIYDYIDRVSYRFRSINLRVIELVELGKKLIPDTRVVFNNSALEYQNDLGAVSLPSQRCIISTMAAQVNYGEFYEAHIDERLFNHPSHSKQSQATLILHELIYASARKLHKHTDSGSTRNLVRMIISYHDSITERSVAENLYDLNLVPTNVNNYFVDRISTSYTMYQISINFFRNLAYSFQDFIEDFRTDDSYSEIILNAIQLAKLDSINSEVPLESLLDVKNLIEVGLKKGRMKGEWIKLNKKLNLLEAIISKDISNNIDGYLGSLEKLLKSNRSYRTLSNEDIINIVGHIKFYFESLEVGYLESSMNKVIDIVEGDGAFNLESNFYTQMLNQTICADGAVIVIDASEGTIVSPPYNDSEDECYMPVLLNNTVPKL